MAETIEKIDSADVEVVDTAVADGAEVAKDAVAAIDDISDYEITFGDVALIGFAAIGVGASAYGIFKGAKKLWNWFEKKKYQKRYEETPEESEDLGDDDPGFTVVDASEE